jgi:hypothetical protein
MAYQILWKSVNCRHYWAIVNLSLDPTERRSKHILFPKNMFFRLWNDGWTQRTQQFPVLYTICKNHLEFTQSTGSKAEMVICTHTWTEHIDLVRLIFFLMVRNDKHTISILISLKVFYMKNKVLAILSPRQREHNFPPSCI